MYLFFLLLVLVSSVSCQSLEEGWKGIRPLKSSKNQVEKVLGESKIDDNGYHGFRTNDAYIQVNYSTEPCQPNAFSRGKLNIPKDRVLDYIVNLTTPTNLMDFPVNMKDFRRETDEHLGDVINYTNKDGSVWITTSMQNGIEYVGRISFRASKTDVEKYACVK